MKRNGFTLIELLAVIVILAIIALIATPIILGIINDAREESNERSIELYASAIKNGIAAYQLREGKGIAAGTYKSSDLTFVEYEGDVECETIDIYEDGKIYVADCKVNGNAIDYAYGTQQTTKGKISSVCTPVSVATAGAYTAGDKYECKVDPNKEAYTFYVLTSVGSDATSVNLIMDSNIREDGTPVKDTTNLGLVAWINNSDLLTAGGNQDDWALLNINVYGPITAMNYIQAATSNWTNLNAQTVSTFTDNSGATDNMVKTYTTYARLPYYSEVVSTGCLQFEDRTCPLWMVDYLEDYGYQTNVVSGVKGYWTLSSYASVSNAVWIVYYSGYASVGEVEYGAIYGVRPVITLDI